MNVIQTETITKRTINKGVQRVGRAYFTVRKVGYAEVEVKTGCCYSTTFRWDDAYSQIMSPHDLREAAKFFNELADVIDENNS